MLRKVKKETASVILSVILGLTNLAACTPGNNEEDIYEDKYVAYMEDEIHHTVVLTDEDGKEIKTDSRIVFVISENKPVDNRYSVIAMDKEGNLYEAYVSEKYIDHFGSKIDKDNLSDISKEASMENCSFNNIPGDVYIYGLSYDEEETLAENDSIDANALPVAVRYNKDLDSKVLTYIYPGDTFVLLPEEYFYQGVYWYGVVAGKRTIDEEGKPKYEMVEGYVNSKILDFNNKYGNVKFIRKNEPAKIKRLKK